MTRFMIGGAVLVVAIIFGLIFWNQFSQNQQQLAGGPGVADNQMNQHKNDNLDLIDDDLKKAEIETIDSDSAQFDTELKGF